MEAYTKFTRMPTHLKYMKKKEMEEEEDEN